MKRAFFLVGALILLRGQAAWAQGSAELPCTFTDPVVRIGPDNIGEISVNACSSANGPIGLRDIGVEKLAQVVFTPLPTSKSPEEEKGLSRFRVEVKGLPPNTTQKHSAAVVVAGKDEGRLEYWLTNRAPVLSVTKVDRWIIQDNHPWDVKRRCKDIVVSSGDIPGTDAQLLQVNLAREPARESVDSQLYICRKDACPDTKLVDLDAGRTTPLKLCLGRGFLWPGNYSGTLWLGTKQKPEGQSIDLTMHVRDRLLRFIGLVLIVSGVCGSWLLRVRSRPQLNRLQALAPAADLRQRFGQLGLRLGRLPEYQAYVPVIESTINNYERDLSEAALDGKNYLPPKPPARINSPLVNAVGYAQFLANASTLLDVLVVVVGGVEEVKRVDSTVPPTPLPPAILTALSDLDKIVEVTPLPTRDAAQAQVIKILSKLRKELVRAKAGLQLPASAAAHPADPSHEQIQVKVRQLNSGFWWAWAVLTVLAGYAFLILSNPVFGNPLDLVTAFVWGFGIPTLLGAVGSNSVAAALGITVPQV